MAWVYILKGDNGRHYIGFTTNLSRRLEEHVRGSCHTTRRLGVDIELVDSIELESLKQARALERKLKTLKNPAKAIRHLQVLRGE